MEEDSEKRFAKLEKLLDAHLPNLYAFIDELRQSHREHERRFVQNEEMIQRLVEMNGNVLRFIDAMDDKIDGLEGRMNTAGI